MPGMVLATDGLPKGDVTVGAGFGTWDRDIA
jgi:hypothetical protein